MASMRVVDGLQLVVGTVGVLMSVTTCATSTPTGVDAAESQAIAAVVVEDFLARYGAGPWSKIYISDEYLGAPLDSALFMAALPSLDIPVEFARRGDIEVPPGVVPNGAMLLEPGAVDHRGFGRASQTLSFCGDDLLGQLLYTVGRYPFGWRVLTVEVLWMS